MNLFLAVAVSRDCLASQRGASLLVLLVLLKKKVRTRPVVVRTRPVFGQQYDHGHDEIVVSDLSVSVSLSVWWCNCYMFMNIQLQFIPEFQHSRLQPSDSELEISPML